MKNHRSPIILCVLTMLLTPVLNAPLPVFLKSPDLFVGAVMGLLTVAHYLKSSKIVVPRILYPIGFGIILISTLCLVNIGIHDTFDPAVTPFFRTAQTIFVSYCFVTLTTRSKGIAAGDLFIWIVVAAAILQGVVIWGSFLFPDFRNFMSIIFYRDLSAGNEHLVLLRVPGFVPSGGDGLSLNHALLCVVGIYGVLYLAKGFRQTGMLVLVLLLALLSTAFTGRSGLLLGVGLSIWLVFYRYSSNNILRAAVHVVWFAGLGLILVFSSAAYLGDFGLELYALHGYEHPVVRLLRGFIELSESGVFYESSANALINEMFFFPGDPCRLLFGNGDFGQLEKAIGSDIGYVRMVHGFGLLGLFVFIGSVFIAPVVMIIKSWRRGTDCGGVYAEKRQFYVRLMVLLLIFGLVAEYKIFYLSSRVFGFLFFTTCFLAAYHFKEARSVRLERRTSSVVGEGRSARIESGQVFMGKPSWKI